jgi:hypothetical protein
VSIANLLTHRMDIEGIANPAPRDSSGGIIDSGYSAVNSNVPCAITALSASAMADFAIAGQKITHSVITLQPGVQKGQRLKVVDAVLGTVYFRVDTVKPVRRRGTVGPFFEIMAEVIQLS